MEWVTTLKEVRYRHKDAQACMKFISDKHNRSALWKLTIGSIYSCNHIDRLLWNCTIVLNLVLAYQIVERVGEVTSQALLDIDYSSCVSCFITWAKVWRELHHSRISAGKPFKWPAVPNSFGCLWDQCTMWKRESACTLEWLIMWPQLGRPWGTRSGMREECYGKGCMGNQGEKLVCMGL